MIHSQRINPFWWTGFVSKNVKRCRIFWKIYYLILIGLSTYVTLPYIKSFNDFLAEETSRPVPGPDSFCRPFDPIHDHDQYIFFTETSGNACLRPRQACAVESAARSNPDLNIYLYMSNSTPAGSPEEDHGEGLERNCATMDVIRSLHNVHIFYQDFGTFFQTTPLKTLYNDMLPQSRYAYQHVGDALRVAILYENGGIYLDLDVVVLRPLHCLRNTAGHVMVFDESTVENGILMFDRQHPFLRFYMKLMQQVYQGDARSSIGPLGLTKAFRFFCNHTSSFFVQKDRDYVCHGGVQMTLKNHQAFSPISYFERNRFFTESFSPKEWNNFRRSYCVHVYGAAHGEHVPETSLYGQLARHYCPKIYQQARKGIYLF